MLRSHTSGKKIIETQLREGQEVQATLLSSTHPWLETNCFLSALLYLNGFPTHPRIGILFSKKTWHGAPGTKQVLAGQPWGRRKGLESPPSTLLLLLTTPDTPPAAPLHVPWVCLGTQFECWHKYTDIGCLEGNTLRSFLYTSFLKPNCIKITIYLSQDNIRGCWK